MSKRFTLNRTDWQKWSKNTLLFLAPLGVIYISFVVTEIKQDGFSWFDFVPSLLIQGSMVLYVLNVILDILRKWASGK